MEKIIKDVQSNFMELRMVSFKPLFQKLFRIARDTSSELGIDINIEILGEDEETDRNIAEKLIENPPFYIPGPYLTFQTAVLSR